jgi:hypothetical protein
LASDGAEVVLSSGTNRVRSVIAIVGVLAVLGGVAAFSGKGMSKAATTTVAPPRTTLPVPTTSVPPSTVPTTTLASTTTTSTDVIEIAVPSARTLTSPIVAEKTGLKLLLIGLQLGSFFTANAIVDLDAGTVTPVVSDFSSFPGQIFSMDPIGSGLLATGAAGSVLWEPDGTTRILVAYPYGSPTKVGRALVWSQDVDPVSGFGKLVAHELGDGHEVVSVSIPQTAGLMGVDSADHAIVSEVGTGTYSLDPATALFTRLSRNMTIVAQGDRRIERSCDDHLVCSTVMVKGEQETVLPDLNFFGEPPLLSPDGRYALQNIQSNTSNSGQILQMVDLALGTRWSVENGNSCSGAIDFRCGRIESVAWSPDSKWLFAVVNGELVAWKVGSAETRRPTFDGAPILAAAVGVFPTG